MEKISRIGLASVALLLALGGCSKGASTTTTTTTTESTAAAPVASATAAADQNGASANDGAKVFQANCSSCHQASGKGVEGTFPPLANNPVVSGDFKKLIHIVKYGLNGKIQAVGHSYDGMMPAWGQQLSTADIASVLTYIRSSWGNNGGAVTAAEVSSVSQ